MLADTLLLFVRGFLQVAPISASTYFVSHDKPGSAVVVGFFISFLWWWNAGSAAHLTGIWWAGTYASGAAVGTWVGQVAAKKFTKWRTRPLPARVDIGGNLIDGR